jgi:hypothetical protein
MLPRAKGKTLSYRGMEYPNHIESQIVKMPGQPRDWQIKCVCGGTHLTCNGGWMKAIEDKARPILIPLITGRSTRLSYNDQIMIATWATLKAMISEYDLGGKVTTHHSQRKRMKNRQLPPKNGWGIWIGHYERIRWKPEWISRPLLILPHERMIKRPSREATYFNSHTSTQVIGNLFIQIIRTPDPLIVERWRFAIPERGTLFHIWPSARFSIKWPGRALTDRDADFVASAFAIRLLEIARREMAAAHNSRSHPA